MPQYPRSSPGSLRTASLYSHMASFVRPSAAASLASFTARASPACAPAGGPRRAWSPPPSFS